MQNSRSTIAFYFIMLFISAVLFFSFIQQTPRKPDESRFTPIALTQPGDLDEPNTFEVLKDGRVLISERKGGIKFGISLEGAGHHKGARIPSPNTCGETGAGKSHFCVGQNILAPIAAIGVDKTHVAWRHERDLLTIWRWRKA